MPPLFNKLRKLFSPTESANEKVSNSSGQPMKSSSDLNKIFQILEKAPQDPSEIPQRIKLCQNALELVDKVNAPKQWGFLHVKKAEN